MVTVSVNTTIQQRTEINSRVLYLGVISAYPISARAVQLIRSGRSLQKAVHDYRTNTDEYCPLSRTSSVVLVKHRTNGKHSIHFEAS